jgi:hypothetical protein
MVALFHPLNLAVLALAAAAGLCAAWWLFPMGMLVWLVLMALVIRQPALQMTQKIENRASLARRFQTRFDQIERTQIKLFNTLNATPKRTQRLFRPVEQAVDRTTDMAHKICARMSALENYRIIEEQKGTQEANLAQLDLKIAQASDPMVRKEFEETRRTVQQRLERMRAINTLLDRVEAQLTSLASAMDNTLTETIRLQALDPKQIEAEIPLLVETIDQNTGQLETFAKEAAII